MLETVGLNQEPTIPRDHLVYVNNASCFEIEQIRTVACPAQWSVLMKQPSALPVRQLRHRVAFKRR
jgi:hypothetical protein